MAPLILFFRACRQHFAFEWGQLSNDRSRKVTFSLSVSACFMDKISEWGWTEGGGGIAYDNVWVTPLEAPPPSFMCSCVTCTWAELTFKLKTEDSLPGAEDSSACTGNDRFGSRCATARWTSDHKLWPPTMSTMIKSRPRMVAAHSGDKRQSLSLQ